MNKIHYCPIGQVQRQFGIYVTGAGKEITKPGEPYPHAYHSSDYYLRGRTDERLPTGNTSFYTSEAAKASSSSNAAKAYPSKAEQS